MEERINAHEQYVKTFGGEGKQLVIDNENLSGYDFSNRNLLDPYLIESNFTNANFQNADISDCHGMWGSIFDRANMSFSKIIKSNANRATFRNTIFTNACIRNTTFIYSILSGAKMENADMADVLFVEADLRNVDMSYSDLYKTSIKRCKVNGLILRGAKNVDTVLTDEIDIGANDIPLILKGEQAKEWLMKQAEQ